MNSLRAAFPLEALASAGMAIADRAAMFRTVVSPYMVAFKSVPRPVDARIHQEIERRRRALPAHHRRDVAALVRFFGIGGLRSALL